MRNLRKLSQVIALSALLAVPTLGVANPVRADSGSGGETTDSRAGVVAAVGCGVTGGIAVRTGLAPVFAIAIFFCGYMLIDAFITPD